MYEFDVEMQKLSSKANTRLRITGVIGVYSRQNLNEKIKIWKNAN